MPADHSPQIDKQVPELVDSKMVDPFAKEKFPTDGSLTFLVQRKGFQDTAYGRTVQEVNEITKCHAVFLAKHGTKNRRYDFLRLEK